MKYQALLLTLLPLLGSTGGVYAVFKMLIIDTYEHNPYQYEAPLSKIAQSVDVSIDYKPLSKVIDTSPAHLDPSHYKAAFFLINRSFLSYMQSSLVAQKVTSIIHRYVQQKNAIVGFFFYDELIQENAVPVINNFMEQMGVAVPRNVHAKAAYTIMLTHQLEKRSFLYATSLKQPAKKTDSFIDLIAQRDPSFFHALAAESVQKFSLLPLKNSLSDQINQLLPAMVYFFDKKHSNHILLGQATFFSLSSIAENYHVCPQNFELRRHFHEALQQTLFEIKLLSNQPTSCKGLSVEDIKGAVKPALPDEIVRIGQSEKPLLWTKAKLSQKTAWMEIAAFGATSTVDQVARNQLISYIFEANLEALWISFAPNEYYSPVGRSRKKRAYFLASIRAFTTLLKEEAARRNARLPRICVGVEISNNFQPSAVTPSLCAYDIFGNSYSKCPSPLHQGFWYQEVINPLKLFAQDWRMCAEGIPLSGVILDLEMYFSPPGRFTSVMDFSESALKSYISDKKLSIPPSKVVSYLLEHHKGKEYFSFLQNKARSLGLLLKKELRAIILQCTLGCYVDKIMPDWFYMGLYQGLSSLGDPLMLLSFNNEFASHQKWLSKNAIFVEHSSVLLLSKLSDEQAIAPAFDEIMTRHHGVWLNRFSRLIESYKNDWTQLENTSLDVKGKEKMCSYLGALGG